MTSESGRISNLLSEARRCDAAAALAKARIYAANRTCSGACGGLALPSTAQEYVPPESVLLEKRVERCTPYISPYTCLPSSALTLIREQCAVSAYSDPTIPEQRFSEFRRPYFPPVCPTPLYSAYQIDASGNRYVPPLGGNISANPAVPQLKACPLPNLPDNPVLPG
jgi:hypothetical protein